MPFVLKHAKTGQIYTCMLVNHYELAYYGTKYWDSGDAAEEQLNLFLQEQSVQDAEVWAVVEISEQQMKVFNVKLRNDPRNQLFVGEDGTMRVDKSAAV